ncbi:unnamed protein product [Cuscuta campestris]|uniref:F-box domain-containing protein n=1 Tax=Cuscuta campestris TaxID=132261 RepID=A0A484K5W5_9ASTE|nr:unnamed protein product [Cuscuta campestris]
MRRRRNQKLKVVESGGENELWLPSSLLADILSRLPCRALARLRFVSKEWNSVVSDRTFVRLQMKPAAGERLSGFFFQGRYQWCDGDIKSVSYIPLLAQNERESAARVEKGVLGFLPEQVVLLSAINGLLCCRSCFPSHNPLRIYVCNPLNREWTALPWPHPPKDSSTALAFRPFHGGRISTDFQIITVCQTPMEEEEEEEVRYRFGFKIYSSRAKEWRESQEVCTWTHKLQRKGCVFAAEEGGTAYWLTEDNRVLMFDLANELCCLIHGPFPASGLDFAPGVCLGEANGRVQYVMISQDGLQVWELEDRFGSQWALKRFLSPEDLERGNPKCMHQVSKKLESHLATDSSSLLIDLLSFKDTTLLLRISTDIYAFDFETGKAKWICAVSALGPNSWFSPIVIPYTMSLAPIDLA